MTTNDRDLAERVRSLRHHGWSPSDRYDDMPAGAFNYRLSDILCAVGIPQVRRLEELLAARERVAAGYAERLARPTGRRCPSADEGDRHGWQAYVIQLDRRDEAMAALRAQGIQCQIGTYALHRLARLSRPGRASPAPTPASSVRWRCRCTRGCTDAELDRVAEELGAVAG